MKSNPSPDVSALQLPVEAGGGGGSGDVLRSVQGEAALLSATASERGMEGRRGPGRPGRLARLNTDEVEVNPAASFQ